MLTIKEEDLTIGSNGRLVYKFTPKKDMNGIQLSSNCFGNTQYSNIQVEEGDEATSFVKPAVYIGNGQPTGLWQAIRAINMEMTDQANSDLWSKIKLNAKGMLQEYHDGTVKSEIIATADTLSKKVEDLDGKVASHYTQLKDLIDLRVTNDDVTGIIQNSGNQIKLALKKSGTSDLMTGEQIATAINLNTNGVKITGRNIMLDGSTFSKSFTAEVAKIIEMDAGRITTGTLNANVLGANSITGKHLSVDQAFMDKFMANDAYLKQLFAKSVFATSVKAVEMDASKITSGVLKARNGVMDINLNQGGIQFNSNASIEFKNSYNSVFRKRGSHTGFMYFYDESKGGVVGAFGVTSSGDGINAQSSGRFAGIRVWRTAKGGTNSLQHDAEHDLVEIYGDRIFISHGFDDSQYLQIKLPGSGFAGELISILKTFNSNFKKIGGMSTYSWS